jgi:hypothetical protein
LALSIAAAMYALLRLTKWPLSVVFCLLAGPLIAPSLSLGQIIPIYFAVAVGAMLFAREERYDLAAVAASASLIEPHLGLPICLSLAMWAPRARGTVALCVAGLAVLSILAGGVAQNAEYVLKVLPLHALAELPADGQISFSALLHGLGVRDAAAIIWGSVSYVAMTIVGIAAARLAAVRFRDNAFLAAVPGATAVFGGTFVHLTDVVAAVPLAALLIMHLNGNRSVLAIALTLLIAPWWRGFDPHVFLDAPLAFGAAAAAYTAWYVTKNMRMAATLGILLFLVPASLGAAYTHSNEVYRATPHRMQSVIDAKYPDASWARAIDERFATGSPASWLLRIPAWAGIAGVILATLLPCRVTRVGPAKQPA